jgi:prolyl oligopeptidase
LISSPTKRFAIRVALCALIAATCTLQRANVALAQQAVAEQPDKYTWLEDIYGDKQLAWVKAENQRTASVIEQDPRYATNQAEALKVLDSPERLAFPAFRSGEIYNTWRDADHVRGIIRRTTLDDYKSADPKWQTVVDYDALSKADGKSWVGKGAFCLEPGEELCLLALSNGGEDAITMREIDLKTGKFVEGGFVLPTAKNRVAWVDKDTLLIGRDWGPGTMSEAGYPITVRVWKRGEPLDKAREIYRGDVKDNGYGDNATVLIDGQGHQISFVERSINTFERETYLLEPSGPVKLGLPLKGGIDAMLDGQLLISIDDDWTPAGSTQTYVKGSELSVDLKAAEKDPVHLKPTVIFAPTATEFLQEGLATTKNHLLLTTLDNVQGRAYVYTHSHDGSWTRKRLPVPDNSSVSIVSASATDDRFFVTVYGFLTPPSIMLGNAADGSLSLVKSQKPLFDSSADVVEQFHATSKDGTSVPYFVVHRRDIKYDGSNPTLLDAYGGFQVSSTPGYSSVIGKLWLEHGGVFVLANIRGGGEFGPAWHEAGLKTHRQRIYDDFYAVAQDLITRKITSTRRLGIMGGSNGGLLMGVEFTQHPDMWDAVVIQVPLLDMLAFEHLSAGASWVGEYGSTSVPNERAFLASISPYNQLKPGVHYPEPLIFTTTRDDRVGPVHARKFAARLEEFHDPFFYDEITEGGHGAGADNKQASRMWADTYTYLMMKLMD